MSYEVGSTDPLVILKPIIDGRLPVHMLTITVRFKRTYQNVYTNWYVWGPNMFGGMGVNFSSPGVNFTPTQVFNSQTPDYYTSSMAAFGGKLFNVWRIDNPTDVDADWGEFKAHLVAVGDVSDVIVRNGLTGVSEVDWHFSDADDIHYDPNSDVLWDPAPGGAGIKGAWLNALALLYTGNPGTISPVMGDFMPPQPVVVQTTQLASVTTPPAPLVVQNNSVASPTSDLELYALVADLSTKLEAVAARLDALPAVLSTKNDLSVVNSNLEVINKNLYIANENLIASQLDVIGRLPDRTHRILETLFTSSIANAVAR